MGAFQSHDAHDHGTTDAFDLSLDVTVAEGALPPRYETPSASQFAIYAHKAVAVKGNNWVKVHTGTSFAMPFMLVLLVRGTGLDWEVEEQVVDYDAIDELVVRVRRRGKASEGGELTTIAAGSRVALGIVLPIARPAFALRRPATADDYNEEEEVDTV